MSRFLRRDPDRKKKPYDRDVLQHAYQETLRGVSVYKASRMYGVPEQTLRDRVHHKVELDCKPGAPTMFTVEEERAMVQHTIYMASIGYGYSMVDMQTMASEYAKSIGKDVKSKLSANWFYGFMDRWDELKAVKHHKPQKLGLPRATTASKEKMKYVHYENGGPENMSVKTTDVPGLRPKEVLVKVYATALNRADTLQRKGVYPPPPGESTILGLEAAGTVEKLGPQCSGDWKVGDRVMALLTGGGYAEFVAVPEDILLPIPPKMGFIDAAGIPEVWLTAYQLLHVAGELEKGDTVLIHAGGSGVGIAAIQLCVLAGCKPIVTAGSDMKIQRALALGAVAGFNYKEVDFSEKVLEFTNDRGVDLILDCIGGSYYESNMKAIRTEGRWVLFGLMGGGTVNGDILAKLLRKRIRITGTTLRARSVEYKKNVTDPFKRDILPLFKEGSSPQLKTVTDSVFSMYKVADAHTYMESNQNNGKIVLQIRNEKSGELVHDEL